MGARWSMPCPCRFTPGKETQHPLYRRLGGPHPYQETIPWLSSPLRVTILTVLSWSTPNSISQILFVCTTHTEHTGNIYPVLGQSELCSTDTMAHRQQEFVSETYDTWFIPHIYRHHSNRHDNCFFIINP